jgi:hypothetical protein
MTNDLAKRLRDFTCDCFSGNSKHMTWEAADRIEQLQAALYDAMQHVSRADRYYLKPETRAALGEKKDD